MRLSRRAVVVLSAVLLGPALPSLATTTGPTVVRPVVQSAALAVGTTTLELAERDQLVGVTWESGDPSVRVRFRTAQGWTAWEVPEDDSDVPSAAERALAREGTEPVWRPRGATLAQLDVRGDARDLEVVRVGDGVARAARGFGLPAAEAREPRGLLGDVRTRADWGADESLRRGAPSYASRFEAVVVHHTAGSNDYARADVPKRIRADYAYHVQARGWSDLGYNVVVDKYGGIWEGRAGGLGRAVVGAHAAGFNTSTLGVSVLGDLTRAAPTREAVRAVARVSAFAAATWRFDPAGSVTLTSRGSPRYRSGSRVRLPRVQGHRDTGRTSCPGALYDRLGDVRAGARTLLGPAPRIERVTVTGAPVHAPTPLVVTAELSRESLWAVTAHDATGAVVGVAEGEGTRPHLEWNGLRADRAGVVPAEPGQYTWRIRVDDGYHPVVQQTGAFEVGLPVVPAL